VLENMARRGRKIFIGKSFSVIFHPPLHPKNRVPTPPWPSIVVREWSPFAYTNAFILVGRKRAFMQRRQGFKTPPIIKLNVKTNRNFTLFLDYYAMYTREETVLVSRAYYYRMTYLRFSVCITP